MWPVVKKYRPLHCVIFGVGKIAFHGKIGTRQDVFFKVGDNNDSSMAMQIFNENVRSLLLCFDSSCITDCMTDRQLRKRRRMRVYRHSLVPWLLGILSSLHLGQKE